MSEEKIFDIFFLKGSIHGAQFLSENRMQNRSIGSKYCKFKIGARNGVP